MNNNNKPLEYLSLLAQWKEIDQDSPEGEQLGDQMDALWYSMSSQELAEINRYLTGATNV